MGKKNTMSRSTQRHPRVYVSRVQAPPRISRNPDSIRERLRNGAKTVVVDTAGQLIELDDKTFASAGDEWTLRLTAGSQARIHLDSPLPATAHIVATDATTVEVTGQVHVWAYTHATVTAFDRCRVIAHNHAFIRACDHSTVWADDNVVVHAYDEATVEARDHAILALSDEARAVVETAVEVRGPARKNVTIRGTT
ncbi:hypothetical protein ACWEK5_47830 [Rhodococcus koreensis]